jgi:hypothetical protein
MLCAGLLSLAPADRARAGFFDELFGGWGDQPRAAAPVAPRPRKRPVNRRPKLASLETHAPKNDAEAAVHAICVRMCDGAVFPAPEESAKDPVRRQASCASACPDAPMRRFTLTSAAEDVSKARDDIDGGAYGELMKRLKHADASSPKSCGCGAAASDAPHIRPVDFLADETLRSGDVVVTSEGLRVYTGQRSGDNGHADAFLALAQTRDMPKSTQGALSAIDRAIKTPRGRD